MNLTAEAALFYSKKSVWPVIFLGLFFSACGYRFAGTESLPADIRSVSIEVLENRTVETGLGNVLTNDLIYEFIRNGQTVRRNKNEADAVFTGVIENEYIRTISRQGQLNPIQRRVGITVNLKLTDPDGKVIWAASGVTDSQAYDVGANNEITQINKQTALKILSQRLSEHVYNRLTSNF